MRPVRHVPRVSVRGSLLVVTLTSFWGYRSDFLFFILSLCDLMLEHSVGNLCHVTYIIDMSAFSFAANGVPGMGVSGLYRRHSTKTLRSLGQTFKDILRTLHSPYASFTIGRGHGDPWCNYSEMASEGTGAEVDRTSCRDHSPSTPVGPALPMKSQDSFGDRDDQVYNSQIRPWTTGQARSATRHGPVKIGWLLDTLSIRHHGPVRETPTDYGQACETERCAQGP